MRLQGMTDMWKEMKPPQPLDFAQLQEESASVPSTISSQDQKVWKLAENFSVFRDRCELFLTDSIRSTN